MSRSRIIGKLETMLESFLDRAADLSDHGSTVLSDIDRLDDIACDFIDGKDKTDELGDWFARHADWRESEDISAEERGQITEILNEIGRQLRLNDERSPAVIKIIEEIDRWSRTTRPGGHKVVLKRGPEIAPPPGSDSPKTQEHPLKPIPSDTQSEISVPGIPSVTLSDIVDTADSTRRQSGTDDTIVLFRDQIDRITGLFADSCERRQHLLSVLDDTLKSAELQRNKDALILSALIIYYLKQSGYLVLPYVERLREAERLQKGAPGVG